MVLKDNVRGVVKPVFIHASQSDMYDGQAENFNVHC